MMKKIDSYVERVSWERIHMTLTLVTAEAVPENTAFYLIGDGNNAEAAFQVAGRDGCRVELKLNVTNSGINRCVKNGTYKLLLTDEESVYSVAGYRGTAAGLEGWGRSFRYLGNKGVYTIAFMLDEYSEETELQLLFYNAVMRNIGHMPPNGEKESFGQRVRKKCRAKGKDWMRRTLHRWKERVYRIIRRHHKPGNYLLFMSEQDDKLALNMQAILKRMAQRGVDKQFDIHYSLRRATSGGRTVKNSIHQLLCVARADIIVVDDHIPLFDWMELDKATRVIQIWHAGAGFKGVGYSRWGHHGCPGPFSCHRQYTYSISGSTPISHFFSEQFGILDEQVIPTGMPRMDEYLDEKNRAEVTGRLRRDYPAINGRRVILFAPTYRGRNRMNAYYPYELIDFERLYQLCCQKDAVVLFKMHPWVPGEVPIRPEHADRFISMNSYPNINELFYVTDLLITDYSSSMYEYSLMRKPMLAFVYDKVQYAASRGFHRDYDSNVPGRVCTTFDELLDAIANEDFQSEKLEAYIQHHFDHTDTHNCDRVIDWLILDELPQSYRAALEQKRAEAMAIRHKHFAFLDEAEAN
ncbi:MAG: CDP-glycerol glycerophosphotransferase family protein [Clostridiales bacterium]|nr:CDP-glycerol glycerophosphotransferase family protein [Candidatus Cacconaster stercorequi]